MAQEPRMYAQNGAALPRQLPAFMDVLRQYAEPAAAYALPFLLVLYLALKGGGYDAVVRSEVGIVAWWAVLLGVAVGVLPRARLPRSAWIGLGLLAAYALWTALGISWSESTERSAAELARVASLLGIFAVAVLAQGRETLRRGTIGVAAGIALVGCLALASRLHPDWFPADEAAANLAAAETRLNYPVNYWNGLAALLAMGMPLLLVVATQLRNVALSALAAATIPALALAAFYTLSRGGAAEIAIALVVLLAIHPQRARLLPTIAVTGLGSTLLIAGATQRDALENSLTTPAAATEADEMIAMTLVVCVAAGLLQAGITTAAKHGLGPRIRIARRTAFAATGAIALAALIAALAAGLPGEISDRWQEFKETPEPTATDASRFESAGGGGRYQIWSASLDANASDPLTGIGAGTFEFWESRESAIPGFVRDAHSLYLEALAELGIVGFVLIVGLVGSVLVIGASRALRGAEPERRAWLAAATAACAAFAAAAAIDWAWELTVLPAIFLILGAGILGPGAALRREDRSRFSRGFPSLGRPVLAFLAIVALIGIAIPLASTASVRDSQAQANAGELSGALDRAERAAAIQPYAATPALQEALVLELQGDLSAAAEAATGATEEEPTNWRTWLVLSRIEAHRGNVGESIAAYREAKQLNPLSPIFE